MELNIGNFQFFLFLRSSLFFKKIYIKLKNSPKNKDIRKGLNNLKYPLLSTIVFSKKSIEKIGANSMLPGEINQTPDNNPNSMMEDINPNVR